MKRPFMAGLLSVIVLLPVLALAAPVTGIYRSTDLGGALLVGRASTWRPGVNSGLPHVLHLQSWNGAGLGTQWDMSCAIETSAPLVQDNRVGGNGTIVYKSMYNGGVFNLYAGGWPWGDGAGTLYTTTLYTTVTYRMVGGVSTPLGSVVNGDTSGLFQNGCMLSFVIANGAGVGETPYLAKPADYPTFLDGTCASASPSLQFGTWGNVLTITLGIDCLVGDERATWGGIKSIYR